MTDVKNDTALPNAFGVFTQFAIVIDNAHVMACKAVSQDIIGFHKVEYSIQTWW